MRAPRAGSAARRRLPARSNSRAVMSRQLEAMLVGRFWVRFVRLSYKVFSRSTLIFTVASSHAPSDKKKTSMTFAAAIDTLGLFCKLKPAKQTKRHVLRRTVSKENLSLSSPEMRFSHFTNDGNRAVPSKSMVNVIMQAPEATENATSAGCHDVGQMSISPRPSHSLLTTISVTRKGTRGRRRAVSPNAYCAMPRKTFKGDAITLSI